MLAQCFQVSSGAELIVHHKRFDLCVQGGRAAGVPPERHAAAAQQHHRCQALRAGPDPPR